MPPARQQLANLHCWICLSAAKVYRLPALLFFSRNLIKSPLSFLLTPSQRFLSIKETMGPLKESQLYSVTVLQNTRTDPFYTAAFWYISLTLTMLSFLDFTNYHSIFFDIENNFIFFHKCFFQHLLCFTQCNVCHFYLLCHMWQDVIPYIIVYLQYILIIYLSSGILWVHILATVNTGTINMKV